MSLHRLITPLLWAYGMGVFVFLYIPMAVVVLFSFNSSDSLAYPLQGFSLQWYARLFQDRDMLNSVGISLQVGAAAVVIALGLGIPAALALDRYPFPGKMLFRRLVLLPLILPGIITGVSLLSFFSFIGFKLSIWTVIVGHGTALISVVVTQVFARLQRMDRAQQEASMDLGANEWQTFRYVTLPNLRTAVIGAALLVFTLSLDEIAVSFFLIGRDNTLPLQIWSMLRRGITPEVNAISTIILAVSMGLIVLWQRLLRDERER